MINIYSFFVKSINRFLVWPTAFIDFEPSFTVLELPTVIDSKHIEIKNYCLFACGCYHKLLFVYIESSTLDLNPGNIQLIGCLVFFH